MDQFAAIEAGQHISQQQLQRLSEEKPQLPLDLQEPDSFPTVWDVQQGLRRLKRGRAPGPNCIPPALLKAGGETFTCQLVSLLTKRAAHSHEPLAWKGGRLHPLHKTKLHPALPEGYRSILVSNFTAKLYHMTLRRPLESTWNANIHSLQLGGRKGQGTDMAHHVLQTFWHWITRQCKPAASVFSMPVQPLSVRLCFQEIVICPCSTRPCWTSCMQHPELHDTIGSVDRDFALDGMSPHMLTVLQDALTDTHFRIDGVEGVCRTRRGTRPGDPIGDILYKLVMSLLLMDAKQQLSQESHLTWYGHPSICRDFTSFTAPPEHGVFDISYVDDCAFGIHGRSNQEVADGIRSVVSAMVVAAARRGLHINFEAGKTEALWNIVGKGSKQWKAQLAEQNSQLSWETNQHSGTVRIVSAYRHLGTWLQIGNVHGREI